MLYTTNFIEWNQRERWKLGTMQGLRVTEQGWLMLEEGASEGIYTTQEVETIPFENLVACWNADTPEGSWVEVSARIYLQEKKTWSPWGSWGRWSPYIERRNRSGEYPVDDPLIRMNCDILEPLCGAGTKLQLRARLVREDGAALPRLRRLTASLRNRSLPEIPTEESMAEDIPAEKILEVPACSQMVRDPEIGNIICNPTTMTVLLAGRGTQVLPEEMGLSCVDLVEGFGNWTYAAAAVGMYGYRAYARFGDYDLLRREIAAGRSVGVSVHYANSREKAEERNLPYLEGAPCTTPGHILTVRGFGTEEGQEYVYVCDSAAERDEEAHLRYRKEQFLEAWSGRLCYLVDAEPETQEGLSVPAFQDVRVKKTSSGRYQWVLQERPFPVFPEMLTEKRRVPGRMTMMIRARREYPNPRMDANDCFLYPQPEPDGSFVLPAGDWTLYLMSNTGERWRAYQTEL